MVTVNSQLTSIVLNHTLAAVGHSNRACNLSELIANFCYDKKPWQPSTFWTSHLIVESHKIVDIERLYRALALFGSIPILSSNITILYYLQIPTQWNICQIVIYRYLTITHTNIITFYFIDSVIHKYS